MVSDEDRLRAVLTKVDVALFAARLARPTDGVGAVKKALELARRDLETLVEDATRHPGKTSTREDDEMRRRELLRYGSLLSLGAVMPLNTMERLSATLAGRVRVDAGLLDELEMATASYARGYFVAAPADLLSVIRGHVNRLETLAARSSLNPDHSYRLEALLSDAAGMAGHLAMDADKRGEARAYWTLARDAARGAGDTTLYSLAVASLGFGRAVPDEKRWYLTQALGHLPSEAPDYARVWLHAHEAKAHATQGNDYGFYSGMERMDQAMARGQEGRAIGAFWSQEAWFGYFDVQGRADYHARGLAALGHREAGDELGRLLDQSTDARQQARLRVTLAEWHLARQEPEAAAQALIPAVEPARALGEWRTAIRDVRRELEPWATLPAVRDLDHALTTAA
jgi:hypothetical protein